MIYSTEGHVLSVSFEEGRRRHLDEPEDETLQSSDKRTWKLRLWTQPFSALVSHIIRVRNEPLCPSLLTMRRFNPILLLSVSESKLKHKVKELTELRRNHPPRDVLVADINAQSELQIIKPSGFCLISSAISKLNLCLVQLGGERRKMSSLCSANLCVYLWEITASHHAQA